MFTLLLSACTILTDSQTDRQTDSQIVKTLSLTSPSPLRTHKLQLMVFLFLITCLLDNYLDFKEKFTSGNFRVLTFGGLIRI